MLFSDFIHFPNYSIMISKKSWQKSKNVLKLVIEFHLFLKSSKFLVDPQLFILAEDIVLF